MRCVRCAGAGPGGPHLPARLTAAKATRSGPGPVRICRGAPAGPGGPERRDRNIFVSVVGRRKGPKAGWPRLPVPQGPPAGHPVHRQRPVQGADQREAAPAQDRGRASALVTPAADLSHHGSRSSRNLARAAGLAVTARGAQARPGAVPAQRSAAGNPPQATPGKRRDRRESPPFKTERKSKRSGDPLPAMRPITYRPHQEGSGCPASNARLRPAFHQPGHDAVRVFGVLDQVQHPEQQDCRRLPEIEHLRRPAQNHPGITQVSLEVIGRSLRGALEQRLCVQGFLSRR